MVTMVVCEPLTRKGEGKEKEKERERGKERKGGRKMA